VGEQGERPRWSRDTRAHPAGARTSGVDINTTCTLTPPRAPSCAPRASPTATTWTLRTRQLTQAVSHVFTTCNPCPACVFPIGALLSSLPRHGSQGTTPVPSSSASRPAVAARKRTPGAIPTHQPLKEQRAPSLLAQAPPMRHAALTTPLTAARPTVEATRPTVAPMPLRARARATHAAVPPASSGFLLFSSSAEEGLCLYHERPLVTTSPLCSSMPHNPRLKNRLPPHVTCRTARSAVCAPR